MSRLPPIIVLLVVTNSAVVHADPLASADRGKVAVLTMKDNLERLEYCRAKYSDTVGKTTNWPDALKRVFWKRLPSESMYPNTGVTKIVKDGDLLSAVVVPDAESLEWRKNPQLTAMKGQPGLMLGVPITFSPDEYVCSKSGVPSYSPGFRGAAVERKDSVCLNRQGLDYGFNEWGVDQFRVFFTSGSHLRAWTLYKAVERGEATMTGDSADYLGTTCERLRFRVTAGKEKDFEYEFLLDPTRGHLPVRMIWTYPKEKHEVGRYEIPKARQLPNDGWFPDRLFSGFTQGNGFWLCRDYTLTEMDVSRRPTTAELSIRLPTGSAVRDCDGGSTAKWVFLKQAEDIHPDDLPRLYELTVRKQADPLADTALPPKRNPWWPWLVCGGVILVAVAVVWRRRIRRGRSSSGVAPT